MAQDLDQTIELAANSDGPLDFVVQAAASPPAPRQSRVKIGKRQSLTGVTERFRESTRQLLHKRLVISAYALIGSLVLIKLLVVAFGVATISEMLLRSFSVTILIGALILLHKRPDTTLRSLRWLELAVIGAPISELLTAQYLETSKLLTTSDQPEFIGLFATISAAISLFIAIYGMFIPSNWRRTAIVTSAAAIAPTAVAWTQVPSLSALHHGDALFAVTTMLTLTMAAVATLGAHVVHQIRREVESARQYGQYKLIKEIGRGSMGIVFKAEHQLLKRPAAIKLIRAESAEDGDAIAGFEREVQLSATLSHWNTVQIYDYGRTENDDFYYVMEFLQGESLKSRLAKWGALSVSDTVSIAVQICDGLAEAHGQGMVHRDLKPANIYLASIGGQNDVVKILDFGLAICSGPTCPTLIPGSDNRGITGTPIYMSPEQAGGQPVDIRSDIYAIGCLLFECLTGNRVADGESIEEVLKQHTDQAPPLELIPESANGLRQVVQRCLSKQVAQRFANVDELKQAILSA